MFELTSSMANQSNILQVDLQDLFISVIYDIVAKNQREGTYIMEGLNGTVLTWHNLS